MILQAANARLVNMGVDGMKMVITDISGNTAVGLRDDGSFVRLHRCGYTVGQTVEIRSKTPIIRLAGVCAAALMLVSGAAAAVRLPYSYVTLDINPSVKYTLNIFNRVLMISAVNEDAIAIVEAIEADAAVYATLDDAIEMTIAQCEAEGYIGQDDEDYVVLSVTSRSQGKTTSLSQQLDEFEYSEGHVLAKVVSTTIHRLREAEQMGTTPGKLTIIGEMQEKTGDTQTPDHWVDVPVREIIRATERGKSGKDDTGDIAKDTEAGNENPKSEKSENGEKANSGNKSGEKDPPNVGQPKTERGTEPYAGGQEPFASDNPNQSAETPEQGQSPGAENNEDRGLKAEESSDGISLSEPERIEQAIAALNEADRELLSQYIEAYEAAIAAEEAAAENTGEAEELSLYRDAVTQALAALCEAAEDNGIALGAVVQDGGEGQRPNDSKQWERDTEGSNHS